MSKKKSKKTVTITIKPVEQKCAHCGHVDDDEPNALIVEDDGDLYDGGELVDDDLMYGTAADVIAERTEEYRKKGYDVKIVDHTKWFPT